MSRTKRRHKTGFSYIGAGNSTSIFNRKPKKVFSKLKNELNSKSVSEYKLQFNNKLLSEEEREKIKNDIRSKNRQKNILTLILSILLLIPIIYGCIVIIENVLAKYR